jgi:hypothetical protein
MSNGEDEPVELRKYNQKHNQVEPEEALLHGPE